jgi:hypothetical protein
MAVAVLLAVVTAAAAVASNGHPLAAVLPALVALAAVGLWRLPLRVTAAAALFISLLAHNPGGRPMMDMWKGPLYYLGLGLYDNLRLHTGIDFLRFNALEVLFTALGLVALMRMLTGDERDGLRGLETPMPVKVSLLASFATVLFLAFWGLVRGGDFRQLLWQARLLFWMPVVAAIFLVALRTPADYRRLGRVIVGVAVLRSLEGLWFCVSVVWPQHLDLSYILTHEDSALFAVALTILGISVLERPGRRTALAALVTSPIIVWGMLENGRRLAYVILAYVTVAALLFVGPPIRRGLAKIALVVSPLLVAYVVAGWGSPDRVFAPINALRSVDDDANASNQTRDIENYNLVHTLLESPVVGSGFGHGYDEVWKGPSIERFMENYRFIAHNSVLWLWSLGGLLGFTLLWMPLGVTMFLARRSYHATGDPTERVAIMAAVAAVIAYVAQAYGDMGAVGWTTTLQLSAGVAVVATIAARYAVLSRPVVR